MDEFPKIERVPGGFRVRPKKTYSLPGIYLDYNKAEKELNNVLIKQRAKRKKKD